MQQQHRRRPLSHGRGDALDRTLSHVARSSRSWQRGIRIGSLKDGKVTTFIPAHKTDAPDGAMGEGIAIDAAGNVYTAEATLRGVTKYVKK